MIEYARHLKEMQNDMGIHDMIIAFNNHFAGFGPQSVNDFLKMLNKPEINWKEEKEKEEDELAQDQRLNSITSNNNSPQTSLIDFTDLKSR